MVPPPAAESALAWTEALAPAAAAGALGFATAESMEYGSTGRKPLRRDAVAESGAELARLAKADAGTAPRLAVLGLVLPCRVAFAGGGATPSPPRTSGAFAARS